VQLEAFNWEDAALKMDHLLHLNWPSRFRFTGWWAAPGETNENKEYSNDVAVIKMYFDAALAYSKTEKPEKINVRFEALRGLFDKSKKLLVHIDDAKSMLEAYELLKTYNIELVYVGAAEAWRIADFLKENNIPVILSN